MQMLHQMREAGHAPELLTYGNVMSACARNGRVSTVLSLLDDVRADGLTPNAFCYNAAVLSCAKARRWRQALSLMREMEQVGGAILTQFWRAQFGATSDRVYPSPLHRWAASSRRCTRTRL